MMEVMVLGAGPAGLLAAQAAQELGCAVAVVSAPAEDGMVRKSELHGCQYLHAQIPGFTAADGVPVRYLLDGTSDGYREKVYGPDYQGSVSVDEYGTGEPHLAWDLRAAYDLLWDRWFPHILPALLTPQGLPALLEAYSPALVLSTVPAPALCIDMENHGFSSEQVWAIGQREDADTFFMPCEDFTVVCNGHRDIGWYRKARVFGRTTVEWPGRRRPPVEGVVRVSKPLKTDCECWTTSGHYVRLGRYGKWEKGVLTHHAYVGARKAVQRFREIGVQGTIWDPPTHPSELTVRGPL